MKLVVVYLNNINYITVINEWKMVVINSMGILS